MCMPDCSAVCPPIAQVSVIWCEVVMDVRQDIWILPRPKPQGRHGCQYGKTAEQPEGARQANRGSEPASQRIIDQPAHVSERELRRENSGTVSLAGRTADEPSRRSLD